MSENSTVNEVRHKSDPESIAISLCVSAIEPLSADQTARVLRYIGGRYLDRLRLEQRTLEAKIETVEQHAREEACDLCRVITNAETNTDSSVTH
jgi:hypothetical protein